MSDNSWERFRKIVPKVTGKVQIIDAGRERIEVLVLTENLCHGCREVFAQFFRQILDKRALDPEKNPGVLLTAKPQWLANFPCTCPDRDGEGDE